jgi:hypothetical protein
VAPVLDPGTEGSRARRGHGGKDRRERASGSLGSACLEEASGRVEPPRSVGSACPMEVSGRAEPPSLGVQCTPLGLGQPRQRSRRGPALIRWGQVPPHQRQNTVVARHRGKQSPSSEVKNSFFCRGYQNLCFFIGEASLSPPHRTLENPKVARPGTGRRGGDAPSTDSSTLGRSARRPAGTLCRRGAKGASCPRSAPVWRRALRRGKGYGGDLGGSGGGVRGDRDRAVAVSSAVRVRPRPRVGASRGWRRRGVLNSDGKGV